MRCDSIAAASFRMRCDSCAKKENDRSMNVYIRLTR